MDRDIPPFLVGALTVAAVAAWKGVRDVRQFARRTMLINGEIQQPSTEEREMASLFAGRDLQSLVPVVLGLLYAGTGGWTERRWETALLIMGYSAAGRVGFMRGYWTDNPAFRKPAPPEG